MDYEDAQTETLDKLYLEWSQFTTAKTDKQIQLEASLSIALNMCEKRTLEDVTAFLKAVRADFTT